MGYGSFVSRSVHWVFVVLEQVGNSKLFCSKIVHAVGDRKMRMNGRLKNTTIGSEPKTDLGARAGTAGSCIGYGLVVNRALWLEKFQLVACQGFIYENFGIPPQKKQKKEDAITPVLFPESTWRVFCDDLLWHIFHPL